MWRNFFLSCVMLFTSQAAWSQEQRLVSSDQVNQRLVNAKYQQTIHGIDLLDHHRRTTYHDSIAVTDDNKMVAVGAVERHEFGATPHQLAAAAGLDETEPFTKNVYYRSHNGIIPAYVVIDKKGEKRYVIDAVTLQIIKVQSNAFNNNPQFKVNGDYSPAPMHPGTQSPSNYHPPYQPQTIVIEGSPSNESPLGWVFNNQTIGNNAIASGDIQGFCVGNTIPTAQDLRFFYTFNPNLPITDPSNANAIITEVFVTANRFHDRMMRLGFAEGNGNFQHINTTSTGTGNDRFGIVVTFTIHCGMNNAMFYGDYIDGSPATVVFLPFMTLGPPVTSRSSAVDRRIAYHEFAHGVEVRLVPELAYSFQSVALAEGWSDAFALLLTTTTVDTASSAVAAGDYSLYGINHSQTYYYGSRRFPYSSDMINKNPLTIKWMDPQQTPNLNNAPMNPAFTLGGEPEVHKVGEIWCSVIWDMRHYFVARYGLESGTDRLLSLLIQAMKMTPTRPNILQARSAIILADRYMNDGEDRTVLQKCFARRGMGIDCIVPNNPDELSPVVESYREYNWADFDGNGHRVGNDWIEFINAYARGSWKADVDNSNNLNANDFQTFVNLWPMP